jgi:hypothetical protein
VCCRKLIFCFHPPRARLILRVPGTGLQQSDVLFLSTVTVKHGSNSYNLNAANGQIAKKDEEKIKGFPAKREELEKKKNNLEAQMAASHQKIQYSKTYKVNTLNEEAVNLMQEEMTLKGAEAILTHVPAKDPQDRFHGKNRDGDGAHDRMCAPSHVRTVARAHPRPCPLLPVPTLGLTHSQTICTSDTSSVGFHFGSLSEESEQRF